MNNLKFALKCSTAMPLYDSVPQNVIDWIAGRGPLWGDNEIKRRIGEELTLTKEQKNG